MALTKQKIRAAVLVAQDELSDEAIAEQIGVTRRTITNWKNEAEFAEYVEEENRQVQAAMLRLDIAKRHKRVAILDEQLNKALRVQEARAIAYANDPEAHGGETGLIVKTVKQIGGGQSAQIVTEYKVDTALQKQIESLMDQAAGELGQKIDKHEHTGKDGGPITHALDLSAFSDEQIDRLAELAEQRLGGT